MHKIRKVHEVCDFVFKTNIALLSLNPMNDQIKSNNNLFKIQRHNTIPMLLQENHEVNLIRVVPLTYTKIQVKNIYKSIISS